MYSRMERLQRIYKSWILGSYNESLRHVTMYCVTLRHQSVSTKARSKKETTKSERRGNNNKTDVHEELSLTNVKKGQRVKIHTGEVQQVRSPCSHPILLTLRVYKHQHTITTHNH